MTDNTVDTPQNANPNEPNQAFEGPWPTEDSSNNTSVEDAFFGSQETTETQEQAPPQEGTPASPPIQEQAQEYNAKNDDKRFEYWQSQASKNQNEVAQIQQQNQELQAQVQAMQATNQPKKPVKRFPAPPDKPKKPRTFSREEAYADSTSESARYLDEYEEWRDDMTDYGALKQEYTMRNMQAKIDSQERQRQDEIQRQDAYAAQAQQMNDVNTHLQGHYGFNDSDAQEFITQMSDPNSLSLDNLVQLYRLQKGQGQPDQNAGPSPEFQQTQRAQQIPSPMGVQTGQGGGNDAKSESDTIMDNMIADFNGKNPW